MTLVASIGSVAALAQNVVLVSTYWMSFQRLSRATAVAAADAAPADMRFEDAAAQVLALLAPYLHGPDRALVERDRRPAITRRG